MTRPSLTTFAVVLPLAVLSACDQSGTEPQDKSAQSLTIPLALRTATLPDNSRLRAFLDVNGTRQDMTISGDTASATVPNLPPGSSSVSIAFEYESPDFGNRMLATAARTLVLQPGENILAFSDQDYQFPDDDNDSYTNLAEIQNSTNPDDRADPPKQWGVARRISFADIDAFGANVTMSADGSALAVWFQQDGQLADGSPRSNLWASHFGAASGWGSAEPISFAEENSVLSSGVAMDALGNAFALWRQGENILVNRFDRAAGWGEPAVRAEFLGVASPFLAINSRGEAAAVWTQDAPNQIGRVAWASRFNASAAGGSPTRISSNVGQVEARDPIAVVDAAGNATAIWREQTLSVDGSPPGPGNLWASRYVAGAGWSSPVQIENVQGDSRSVNVAMDGNGNALVAWAQFLEPDTSFMATRFNASTGTWNLPELITSDIGSFSLFAPAIEFNLQGEALAVWIQNDFVAGQGTVSANALDPVSGWADASPITVNQPGFAEPPALAIGGGGEALAAWVQTSDTQDFVWASRFDPVVGWGPPELVGFENSGTPFSVRVDVDDAGRGLAVWSRAPDGGGVEAWGNRLQ